MEKLTFNTDFIAIYSNENRITTDEEILYLENIISGDVVKISNIEYNIIKDVVDTNISNVLKNNQDIEEEDIYLLIEKAIELDLILTEKNKAFSTSPIRYLLDYISLFFKYLGIDIAFPLKGNVRFFSVLILIFSKYKEKTLKSNRFTIPIFITFSLVSLFLIPNQLKEILTSSPISINDLSKEITGYNFFLFVFLICIASLLHEIGHYIIYRNLGGKYKIFGLGILYVLIPIFFIRIPDTSFWTRNKKMILLYLGGILFDLIIINFVCFFLINIHLYYVVFFFLIFQLFSFITNINFLLPSTDGYFIFQEIFGIKDLYGESFTALKNIFKKKVLSKNTMLILYFIISNIMVFSYWITIALFVITPLLYKMFFL